MTIYRYQNQLYRTAAKDYAKLYRDAVESGAVPSWDQMFGTLLEEGMLDTQVEDSIEYYGGDEAKGIEEAKNSLKQNYYESVLQAVDYTEQDECWRRICTKELVHPREIDPIGIFWAHAPDGAQCYWKDADRNPVWYLFRARVNPKGIDLHETVRMNMINDEEYEVRFHEGTKLWVLDAEVWISGDMREVDEYTFDEADQDRWEQTYYEKDLDIPEREFEKTWPINDWRKA